MTELTDTVRVCERPCLLPRPARADNRYRRYSDRDVEHLRSLAPRDPSVESLALGGAVIEAHYVRKDPVLLGRIAESLIPWVVDPQSIRFSSPRFASTRLATLPYAPDGPLDPSRMSSRVKAMVRGAMEFQAEAEPTMYVVPSLALVRSSLAAFRADSLERRGHSLEELVHHSDHGTQAVHRGSLHRAHRRAGRPGLSGLGR